METEALKEFLDEKYLKYNTVGFIENDPVCIPRAYTKKQDIEITAFWASILAWGQRKTIINKCKELFHMMDNSPHDFILGHSEEELKRFLTFKHRTFNDVDTLYFIEFFKNYYQQNDSLEALFKVDISEETIERGLINFHDHFFSLPYAPQRTRKHIATPVRNSACKRLNMFLRWMVRQDEKGVDFGIWKQLQPRQLICPCDVHVERVAKKLGLIKEVKSDWKTACSLTKELKKFDPEDPVKYDFALFGLGVENIL